MPSKSPLSTAPYYKEVSHIKKKKNVIQKVVKEKITIFGGLWGEICLYIIYQKECKTDYINMFPYVFKRLKMISEKKNTLSEHLLSFLGSTPGIKRYSN